MLVAPRQAHATTGYNPEPGTPARGEAMLKTVRDACQPHKMAFDYAMSNQIEDLEQLIKGEADGEAFFEKTFITAGMNS